MWYLMQLGLFSDLDLLLTQMVNFSLKPSTVLVVYKFQFMGTTTLNSHNYIITCINIQH